MTLPASNQAVEDIRDVIDAADAQLIAELGRVDPLTTIDIVTNTINTAAATHIAELRALGLPVLDVVETEDGRSISTDQFLGEIALGQYATFLDTIRIGVTQNDARPGNEQHAAHRLVRRNWLAGPLMAPYKHLANLDPAQNDRVSRQREYRDSVIRAEGLEERGKALRAVFFRIGSADADRYQAQFFAANGQDLDLPEIASLGLDQSVDA